MGTAFTDIEIAVSNTVPNATINIAEGVYSPMASITINIPLTIIGGFSSGGGRMVYRRTI